MTKSVLKDKLINEFYLFKSKKKIGKLGKNNIFLSKAHQNSEKHNFLKDVKIDLEFNPENKESVINSASAKRSSISELKKELMSFANFCDNSNFSGLNLVPSANNNSQTEEGYVAKSDIPLVKVCLSFSQFL